MKNLLAVLVVFSAFASGLASADVPGRNYECIKYAMEAINSDIWVAEDLTNKEVDAFVASHQQNGANDPLLTAILGQCQST